MQDKREENTDDREQKIRELEDKIADLKGRIPAHSVQPAMIQELEALEDELRKLKES
jgi:TolA-binding protein